MSQWGQSAEDWRKSALVKERYLRAVPLDPITKTNASWNVTPPEDPKKGAVYDVRSGASANGRDGTPYANW